VRRLAPILWCVFVAVAGPVASGPVTGDIDPAYQHALDLWLSDDEAHALPMLATLAADGSTAAQMLIGLIDKTIALQGPWLALLPKAERIELLRDQGGLSGTSWMRRIDDLPVATILLQVLDSEADVGLVLTLADFGEPGALRRGLIALEARQSTGFSAFAQDPRYPDAMRYLIWREWQKDGDRDDELAAALNALPKGDPQREVLMAMGAEPEHADWLLETKLGTPLKALCERTCPARPATCMLAGMRALGGYRQVVTIGTPLVALIPEARFADSQRGQMSVLRRAMAYAFLTRERIGEIAKTDACFAGILATEGQRF
jgi:hypothetical protein